MDGMKPGTRTHGPASLRLSYSMHAPANERGNLLEVTHVETAPAERGHGAASLLLQKVCAEADAARKVLMLFPKPYGDGAPLDQEQLIDWYSGFGFELIQTRPAPLMARVAGALPRVKVRPVAAALGLA
jgi:predicted GNAT family acetyltransferase